VSGPCLSSSVTGRPLRPATRHSLGEPLPHQQADRPRAHQEASCDFSVGVLQPLATCGINSPFGELSPTSRQITHVLRTRAPLSYIGIATNVTPFDLHVLSTPPAFVLSQNQTLRENGSSRTKLLKSVPWTPASIIFDRAMRGPVRNGPLNFLIENNGNAQFSKLLFVCYLFTVYKNLRSEFCR
jgi:hypothetical protein